MPLYNALIENLSLNSLLTEGIFDKFRMGGRRALGKLGIIIGLIFSAAACQNATITDRDAAIQQIQQDFAKKYGTTVSEIDTTSVEFKKFVEDELEKLESNKLLDPANIESPLCPANPVQMNLRN